MDIINKAPHYQGAIETIDYLESSLTPEQFEGFLTGNLLKYVSRYNKKGHPKQDLLKAQYYLNRLLKIYEDKGNNC